jgi:hypothetical protein
VSRLMKFRMGGRQTVATISSSVQSVSVQVSTGDTRVVFAMKPDDAELFAEELDRAADESRRQRYIMEYGLPGRQ